MILIPAPRSLVAVLCASVVSFVSIPLFGHISDRIGRRKMYMLGAATVGVFGFIYFEMLNTRSLPVIFLAIVLSLIPHDMMYGPQAALIAESFTGRLRCIPRLPTGFRHCGWSCTVDRYLAVHKI